MKQKIQKELNDALKYNLSFAGCGFLGIYHVGVAVAFKKFAPQLLLQKISGASAGALAATCLLTDMPLGEMTSDFFRIVGEARSHSLGPFSPSFDIQTCLLEGMSKHLPEDAHLRVNGKLHISLTRVYDGRSIIVSQFNSREDLLDALLCACFIPGFSGIIPPKFHGVRYMDGAFSDNLPTLDENTVTVSPFCGESDICPRDDSAQMFHVNLANTSIEISRQNIYRFVRILFPPKAEILSNMCQQGFDDALHFLHRNHLISCTKCLAIQSTFVLSKQTPEHFDPQCSTCRDIHHNVIADKSMPESVLSAMEKYIIKNSSSGIFKWLQSPALFILRTMYLPAQLPCDFAYACICKLLVTAPLLKENIWGLTKYVLDNIIRILREPVDPESLEELDMYKRQFHELYISDPTLKKFEHVGPRKSIVDFYSSEHGEPDFEVRDNVLSRRGSTVCGIGGGGGGLTRNSLASNSVGNLEALDDLANMTSQHNPLYSYRYVDGTDHTMKFNKIFDMNDIDTECTTPTNEMDNDVNQMLQYDDSEFTLHHHHHDDECNDPQMQHNLNLLLPESKGISSEWKFADLKIDEINSANMDSDMLTQNDRSSSVESLESFYNKPEADQSEAEQIMSANVIDVLNKDTKNYAVIAKDCSNEDE